MKYPTEDEDREAKKAHDFAFNYGVPEFALPLRPPSDLDWIHDFMKNEAETNDEAYTLVREVLIDWGHGIFHTSTELCDPKVNEVLTHIDNLDREALTTLYLEMSICPIHQVDYAACFDDEDPECVQVRFIHPAHDT